MYIQEYNVYKFDNNQYSSLIKKYPGNIYFLSVFLLDVLYYDFRMNIKEFIQSLDSFNTDGQAFNLVELDIDHENKLIYLSEPYDNFMQNIIDQKKYNFYATTPALILCQKQLIQHAVLSQENFIHILLIWIKYWKEEVCFALLYVDDQNWYDVLPFDSQQAMEKFVADHTKIEHVER